MIFVVATCLRVRPEIIKDKAVQALHASAGFRTRWSQSFYRTRKAKSLNSNLKKELIEV